MKRFLLKFRNKYLLVGSLFVLYILFLDDVDIFMIFSKYKKLHELRVEKKDMYNKLIEIENMQSILSDKEALESFAREKNLFKKDNEDIFVISQK
jgi:hypothetical protein